LFISCSITEKGVAALLKQAKRLRWLNVRGTGLTSKFIESRMHRYQCKCDVLADDGVHQPRDAKAKRRSLNLTNMIKDPLRTSSANTVENDKK
jgi:hypothetical protein